MKPMNNDTRIKAMKGFAFRFIILIIFFFGVGYLSIITGKKGIAVLEERHQNYKEKFRIEAALSFEIDKLTKQLYQLKNKERSLHQHKTFQGIISELRAKIDKKSTETMINEQEKNIYNEMMLTVKEIQSVLDKYQQNKDEYEYQQELLDKCIQLYRENLE
ncbi:MAG: hypothetical protein N4A45_00560 [Flavobacteriales bacterium]|jgi:hypothetical protein|nr:hypothetical protein [Flavobacteriales bacterium]